MSRFPDLLVETQFEIHKVRQNIAKLQQLIETGSSEDIVLSNRLLHTLSQQLKMLEKIAEKQARVLRPQEETEIAEEPVLYSYVYSETTVDVLEQSDTMSRAKLIFKDRAAVIRTELKDSGDFELTEPHSLPLFLPFFINKFKFGSAEEIVNAAAQAYEAYLRRCDSVSQVQEEHRDILNAGTVERDYPCTCVEFRLSFTPPEEPENGLEFIEIRIFYDLNNVRGKKVEVNITGSPTYEFSEFTNKASRIFKKLPFHTAFKKFVGQ